MHKLSLLILAGLVLASSSYQMLATDSLAGSDQISAQHDLEIVTRNAAIRAFTEAKHLIEANESLEPFLPPGAIIDGEYDGALYRAYVVSDGETVDIHARASVTTPSDTVDFAVSAEVEWESFGDEIPESAYLVLRAYHEDE